MARYELQVKKSVAKDLDSFPKKDVQRIVEAINGLADDPRPLQSLKLCGAGKYRLRYGVYRILYEIQNEMLIVCVVKVGRRKDAYR